MRATLKKVGLKEYFPLGTFSEPFFFFFLNGEEGWRGEVAHLGLGNYQTAYEHLKSLLEFGTRVMVLAA